MKELTSFITSYGVVIVIGFSFVLLMRSGQMQNRSHIKWLAWESVKNFAIIVDHCDLPVELLIKNIETVRNRFEDSSEDLLTLSDIMRIIK